MKETEAIFYRENDTLYNHFLEDYYYKDFRSDSGEKQIELIMLPKCNLCCKYCYINKFYDKTYTNYDFKQSKINLLRLLEFYEKNKFKCAIDIFSGEFLAQEDGYKFLEIIYEFFKDKEYKPRRLTMPTNYTFILSDEQTQKVQGLIDKFRAIDIQLWLSASFDGKYMEQNRPFKHDLDIILPHTRDDAYYDKVFAFNVKNSFGFHPMIYNEGIEYWIQNFEWFQEQFKKFGIPWTHLYLLQVRNDGWTKQQNIELYKFIRYLIKFSAEQCNDKEAFKEFLVEDGFNILSPGFWNSRQGLPCSLQSNLPIRISDLKSFPCHRLMYPDLEIGTFTFDDDKSFNTINAELGLTIYGCNNNYFPICSKCPIRDICSKGCLGSQFEVNSELFTPIQSVCNNYYYLYKAIADGLDEEGILDDLLQKVPEKRQSFNFLRSIKIEL